MIIKWSESHITDVRVSVLSAPAVDGDPVPELPLPAGQTAMEVLPF